MELKAVNEWLIDNKLSLHLGKTESILFGSKRKLVRHSELIIKCGDNLITPKSEIKYRSGTFAFAHFGILPFPNN